MIELRVRLDDSMVDLSRSMAAHELAACWSALCAAKGLDRSVTAHDLFDLSRLPATAADFARVRAAADYLAAHRERSIEHISAFLPPHTPPLTHDLTVMLLPFAKYNYGPREGLQLFSLHPDASSEETYLFLVHVYYHELTPLSYNARCRRCASSPASGADLKYSLRLLIRNEGIANYAVLDDLLRLVAGNPGWPLKYFTYAPLIGNEDFLDQALVLFDTLLAQVGDGPLRGRDGQLVARLKNGFVPVINLVGIQMAAAIAARFGVEKLIDVYQQEADAFFRLYAETGDRPLGALARL